MRKTSLITAILLLSAVWAVAQTSPSSSPQSTTPDASSQQSTSPSSTSPSQQPSSSTTTQTTTTQTTETSSGNSIEGCLSGSAGNWTLTDQSGKTYHHHLHHPASSRRAQLRLRHDDTNHGNF